MSSSDQAGTYHRIRPAAVIEVGVFPARIGCINLGFASAYCLALHVRGNQNLSIDTHDDAVWSTLRHETISTPAAALDYCTCVCSDEKLTCSSIKSSIIPTSPTPTRLHIFHLKSRKQYQCLSLPLSLLLLTMFSA